MTTILITGAAGFIGFHVAKRLLDEGHTVVGVDNLNDYYDPALKEARLAVLEPYKQFFFYPANIANAPEMQEIVASHAQITHVVHLAAQAGVRYSLENPFAYVESNLVGHMVMLELCRNHLPELKHCVYASSSSVYGANTELPFSIDQKTDTPLSLYAATKKADELFSYSYSHLYKLPLTGLRFFTVYGPWGRPDMATYQFTQAIDEGRPITVYNNGQMQRDFTYIDDIVEGVIAVMKSPSLTPQHRVYNIGNNRSENLMDFIHILERVLGKKAEIIFAPRHPGDVEATWADIDATTRDFGFMPKTAIEDGLPRFVEWYRGYGR